MAGYLTCGDLSSNLFSGYGYSQFATAPMNFNPMFNMGFPGMNFNQSIFPSVYGGFNGFNNYSGFPGLNMSGYNPSMFSMAGVVNPMMNMSMEERMDYMSDIQDKMYEKALERAERRADMQMERQINQIQRQNALKAPQIAAEAIIGKIYVAVRDDNKEEVLSLFKELKHTLADMPQNKMREKIGKNSYNTVDIPDAAINMKALNLYRQVTGTDLLDDIKEHCSGPAWNTFKKFITLRGCGEKLDSESLSAEILGKDDDKSNDSSRVAGGAAAVGVGLTGVVAGAKAIGRSTADATATAAATSQTTKTVTSNVSKTARFGSWLKNSALGKACIKLLKRGK